MAALTLDGTTDVRVAEHEAVHEPLGLVRVAFSGKTRTSTSAIRPYRRVHHFTTASISRSDGETLEGVLAAHGTKDATGDFFDGTVEVVVDGPIERDEGADTGGEVVISFSLAETSPVSS